MKKIAWLFVILALVAWVGNDTHARRRCKNKLTYTIDGGRKTMLGDGCDESPISYDFVVYTTDTSAALVWTTDLVAATTIIIDECGNDDWDSHNETGADSTTHYILLTGLSPKTCYEWSYSVAASGCIFYTDFDDTMTFWTECPTVVLSDSSTKELKHDSVTFNFTTSHNTFGFYAYKLDGDDSTGWYTACDTDADSTGHTVTVGGLLANKSYLWKAKARYSGCENTDYFEVDTFLTPCPTVAKSDIETKAVGVDTAVLTFNTDHNVQGCYRYHESGEAWSYEYDADDDSTAHTMPLSGLTIGKTYTWESATIFLNCDTTAFEDSTSFSTCPTVAASNIETKAITSSGATLTLDTDYDAHVGYKYSKVSPVSWTYKKDADADSTGHTVAVTGLTANHNQYMWQYSMKYGDCDSTAMAAADTFYTTCEAVSAVGALACNTGFDDAFEVSTGARSVKVQIQMKAGAGGEWADILAMEASAQAGYRCITELSLSASTAYYFQWKYIDECGTTSDWVALGNWTSNATGHFTASCEQCGLP